MKDSYDSCKVYSSWIEMNPTKLSYPTYHTINPKCSFSSNSLLKWLACGFSFVEFEMSM